MISRISTVIFFEVFIFMFGRLWHRLSYVTNNLLAPTIWHKHIQVTLHHIAVPEIANMLKFLNNSDIFKAFSTLLIFSKHFEAILKHNSTKEQAKRHAPLDSTSLFLKPCLSLLFSYHLLTVLNTANKLQFKQTHGNMFTNV